MKYFILLGVLYVFPVLADISCRNILGDDVYLYPGMDKFGNRIAVAEFNSSQGENDFMKCNSDYTSCAGKKYRFSRTLNSAVVVGIPNRNVMLNCNNTVARPRSLQCRAEGTLCGYAYGWCCPGLGCNTGSTDPHAREGTCEAFSRRR